LGENRAALTTNHGADGHIVRLKMISIGKFSTRYGSSAFSIRLAGCMRRQWLSPLGQSIISLPPKSL
jgi:hypothetical protein